MYVELKMLACRCEVYGHLQMRGKPIGDEAMIKWANIPAEEFQRLFTELRSVGLPAQNSSGIYYFPDEVEREKKRRLNRGYVREHRRRESVRFTKALRKSYLDDTGTDVSAGVVVKGGVGGAKQPPRRPIDPKHHADLVRYLKKTPPLDRCAEDTDDIATQLLALYEPEHVAMSLKRIVEHEKTHPGWADTVYSWPGKIASWVAEDTDKYKALKAIKNLKPKGIE